MRGHISVILALFTLCQNIIIQLIEYYQLSSFRRLVAVDAVMRTVDATEDRGSSGALFYNIFLTPSPISP